MGDGAYAPGGPEDLGLKVSAGRSPGPLRTKRSSARRDPAADRSQELAATSAAPPPRAVRSDRQDAVGRRALQPASAPIVGASADREQSPPRPAHPQRHHLGASRLFPITQSRYSIVHPRSAYKPRWRRFRPPHETSGETTRVSAGSSSARARPRPAARGRAAPRGSEGGRPAVRLPELHAPRTLESTVEGSSVRATRSGSRTRTTRFVPASIGRPGLTR